MDRVRRGTGLGLSLSYDIIKAHGGIISVNTVYCPPGGDLKFDYEAPPDDSIATSREGERLSAEDSTKAETTFTIVLPNLKSC